MDRRNINPWTWQDNLGFVQATEISGVQRQLLCSGQTSIDADGNPIHAGDMAGQVNEALDNLETVLSQAGYSMSDVVRLNYYTTDVDSFFEVYAQSVIQRLSDSGCLVPATLLGVSRLAFPELLIEIEATAAA